MLMNGVVQFLNLASIPLVVMVGMPLLHMMIALLDIVSNPWDENTSIRKVIHHNRPMMRRHHHIHITKGVRVKQEYLYHIQTVRMRIDDRVWVSVQVLPAFRIHRPGSITAQADLASLKKTMNRLTGLNQIRLAHTAFEEASPAGGTMREIDMLHKPTTVVPAIVIDRRTTGLPAVTSFPIIVEVNRLKFDHLATVIREIMGSIVHLIAAIVRPDTRAIIITAIMAAGKLGIATTD